MAGLELGHSASISRYLAASSKTYLTSSWHSTSAWEGKVVRKGSVRGAAKATTFETALGLDQAASRAPQPGPPAADGGGCTDAAGPPAADGGGGGGTDAHVIELTRMTSAIEAQIERLDQRYGVRLKGRHRRGSAYIFIIQM